MRSRAIRLDAPPPDLDLPGIDGRRHSLAALRGRRVVLLFYRGHW